MAIQVSTGVVARFHEQGRLRVEAIHRRFVKTGLQRWEVWAEPREKDPREPLRTRLLLSTLSDWKASVCQRALDLGQDINAVWIETPYGEEIVTVELVK